MPFDNIQPERPAPDIEGDWIIKALRHMHGLLDKGYMPWVMHNPGRTEFCAMGAIDETVKHMFETTVALGVSRTTLVTRLAAHVVKPPIDDPKLPPSEIEWGIHDKATMARYIEQAWQIDDPTMKIVHHNNQTDKETTLKMVSDAIATRRNELMALVTA